MQAAEKGRSTERKTEKKKESLKLLSEKKPLHGNKPNQRTSPIAGVYL